MRAPKKNAVIKGVKRTTNQQFVNGLINADKKLPDIKVGILTGSGTYSDTNVTVAQVGWWNEFGTRASLRNISGNKIMRRGRAGRILKSPINRRKVVTRFHSPARPFLRPTIKMYIPEMKEYIRRNWRFVLLGVLKLNKFYGTIGQTAATKVQQAIRNLLDPPNAPSTLAHKKSTHPLIDTGRLRRSITWAPIGKK